jgi:hypothetical protein
MLENRKQKRNTEEKLALVLDRNCLSATSHTSSSARSDVNRLAVFPYVCQHPLGETDAINTFREIWSD